MQRFFFHICDGVDVRDEEGVLLEGADEARVLAVSSVSRLLKDLGRRRWSRTEWAMQVTNEQGATICKLSFFGFALSEAVEPT